ncbi:MAG: hypothetical protein EAZ53_10565 [Bacteroidetes bacterium]|nr:MAG: hypothetical protein EAZ53_10565 [Bacteroidota bacterium]
MKIEYKETYQTTKSPVFIGIFVLCVGLLLFAKAIGIAIPDWMMSWEMLIIGISLLIGFKKRFARGFWIILLLIGLIFIVEDIFPSISISTFIWPIALIFLGIWLITSPKSKKKWQHSFLNKDFACYKESITDSNDLIEVTSLLGGVKKSNHSQNFKGGTLTATMAGIELNLLHADIQEKAILDLNIVMGGIKLLIPSHWMLDNQVVAVMGGIEDERLNLSNVNPSKTLILTGTATMGGIEIKSI